MPLHSAIFPMPILLYCITISYNDELIFCILSELYIEFLAQYFSYLHTASFFSCQQILRTTFFGARMAGAIDFARRLAYNLSYKPRNQEVAAMKSALLGFLDAVKRYRGRFLAVACAMFAVAGVDIFLP